MTLVIDYFANFIAIRFYEIKINLFKARQQPPIYFLRSKTVLIKLVLPPAARLGITFLNKKMVMILTCVSKQYSG